MKKTYFIIVIALICTLGISFGITANKNTENLNDIFNKNVEDITFEELEKSKEELLRINLSSEESAEYEKKLKQIIMRKNEITPKMEDNKSDIDRLIEIIKIDISYLDESIKYRTTLSEENRNLRKQQLKELEIFVSDVETKEKSYDYYFSIYEEQRLKYIEKYTELKER